MGFPDFPFPVGGDSFISHTLVLKYLEDYAQQFDLYKFIQFGIRVRNIKVTTRKLDVQEIEKWTIQTEDVATKLVSLIEADAVILCVGSYSVPVYPRIQGLDTFSGRVLHSHDYRDAQDFRDQRVTLVGGGPSGIDIAVQLCSTAKQVNLCHGRRRIFTAANKPEQLSEESLIIEIKGRKILPTKGISFDADVIILCTGYEIITKNLVYANSGLEVSGAQYSTLYRHMMHTVHPSLAVLGVLKQVVPFPLFNQQVLFLLSIWKGETKLPSAQEMRVDVEREFNMRAELGWPTRYAHSGAKGFQWALTQEMEKQSGIGRLPEYYANLYKFVSKRRSEDPAGYKNDRFVIMDDKTFELCQ